MPSDPNIILGIKPPQVQDPLSTIGALQQLRSGQIEQSLRTQQMQTSQAQMQDIQAQAAARNRALQDQNTLQGLLKNGNGTMSGPDFAHALSSWNGTDAWPLDGLVSPEYSAALKSKTLIDQQAQAAITKDTAANNAVLHGHIQDTLNGLLLNPDGTQRADADIARDAPGAIAGLVANKDLDPKTAANIHITDFDSGHQFAVFNRYQEGLNDYALAGQKKQQDLKTSAAAAGKDVAQGSQATAEAALTNFKLGMMKGASDPTALNASVDQLIDPVKYPQANRDAKAAGALAARSGDPAKVTEAVQSVYNEQVGGVTAAVTKAKALAPVEVAKSVATARATAPIEIQKAVDTQVALAKNSPDAFAGIVDPFARHQAMTQYAADSKEYADSVSAARELGDLITSAQGGNKAAPGVIPVQELRGFVNRVNSQELRAVSSGAGSLLDKVQGWANGATEGQPIPPDILAATKQIAQLQEQAAARKYDLKLQFVRQQGGKVQPVDLGNAPGATYQRTAKDATGHEIGSNDNWATSYDTATGKKIGQ